jgi:hypothetical protein
VTVTRESLVLGVGSLEDVSDADFSSSLTLPPCWLSLTNGSTEVGEVLLQLSLEADMPLLRKVHTNSLLSDEHAPLETACVRELCMTARHCAGWYC